MREIKFRGKRLGNGEWVYGDLLQGLEDDKYIVISHDEGVTKYEVDPDTVGQFTGMRDKNGVELFENDIIESIDDIGQIARHRIVYDYSSGGWVAIVIGTKFKGYVFRFNQLWLTTHNKTIIGNIYDNHELLEGDI